MLTEYKSHITFAKASTLKEALRRRILQKSSRVLMEIAMFGEMGGLPMYPWRISASKGEVQLALCVMETVDARV